MFLYIITIMTFFDGHFPTIHNDFSSPIPLDGACLLSIYKDAKLRIGDNMSAIFCLLR